MPPPGIMLNVKVVCLVEKENSLNPIPVMTSVALIPKKYYRKMQKWAERNATRWNGNTQLKWFGFQTVDDMKHHYDPDILDNLIKLEFEGKKYFAFKDYDQILRDEFGDYMQLPPEEERVWKHRPILIDFEKNYN